jgi:hypothetical protein
MDGGKKRVPLSQVRRISSSSKRKESHFSAGLFLVGSELQNYDVSSLQTLGAFFDGEFHLLAFLQVLEAFALDGREVDEDIGAAFTFDEAEALCSVEPFNRTDYTIRHFLPPKQNKK